MGFPRPIGNSSAKGSNGSCTGNRGRGGGGVEEEDRMERGDKVERRLSARLIDSSTPTGINTRKLCLYVCT